MLSISTLLTGLTFFLLIGWDVARAGERGRPWPLPQQMVTQTTTLVVDPKDFVFDLNRPDCEILQKAVQRYEKSVFLLKCAKDSTGSTTQHRRTDDAPAAPFLKNISIKVQGSCEGWPYMNMDEMYLLKIDSPDDPGRATLFSQTVWGILRGLETFNHLAYPVGNGLFAINSTMILDYPRFSHRGVMLDTSRHFLPVHTLKENLEAMAQNKFNVFHWHIVDDQSFPYQSTKYPDLSHKGSYDPQTHVYSLQDVAGVVEFGRQRGIRVVPEFDSPGHTLSWGRGQPGLLTACYAQGRPDGSFGPVDPTKGTAYDFMTDLLSEVGRTFPDGYMHLGGDEVDFTCWKSNPQITDFMKSHGFGNDYSKLEQYYEQRLLDIVKGQNKSYIIWQEVIDNNVRVKPDTVVHVWKDPHPEEMAKVTGMGYKTLLSTCWYLNYISYGIDWQKYYTCDPQEFNGTDAQKKLVMGGEACMWGEDIDASNVMATTWPRAAAVAERLWSDKSVKDANEAAARLEEQRCRMMKRGLTVEPISGPGYCPCDHLM